MSVMRSVLVAIVLAASAAPATPARAQVPLPFPTRWSPILVCEAGRLVVDVNEYERRMVQVVVNDREISAYLWQRAAASSAEPGLTARFYGIAGMSIAPGTLNEMVDGKLIVQGQVPHGIFSAGDLGQLRIPGFSGLGIANSGTLIGFTARRDADTLTILLDRAASTSGVCTGHISPSTGACEAGESISIPAGAAGDWTFRDCHAP